MVCARGGAAFAPLRARGADLFFKQWPSLWCSMRASYMPSECVRDLRCEDTEVARKRARIGVDISLVPQKRCKVTASVATFKRARVRARAVVRSANVVGKSLGVGRLESAVFEKTASTIARRCAAG